MIVKILQKSSSFKAVRYNTGKVERDRGELLLVENFGVLQGIENLRPQDYINYFEAISSRNSRIKYPQFHVAISTKGQAHSKEELSAIAQQWMEGMGYGNQPYLLIYHKDTANNHIHIVSSRVGRDGKKIPDTYEKIRAYRILNQILEENERHTLAHHLQKALSYGFSTRAQFSLLLELQGYGISIADPVCKISKYGRVLDEIDLSIVDTVIANRVSNKARITQIRAIIQRYASNYDNKIQIIDGKYSSVLSDFLHKKHGIQFIFHGKHGRTPNGYTIIDHAAKSVNKGGEIMPLREFIAAVNASKEGLKKEEVMLEHMLFNPESTQLEEGTYSGDLTKTASFTLFSSAEMEEPANSISLIEINISDDVDDEAIYGRRRRGKQKTGSIKR